MAECIECGDDVPGEEAVYGMNGFTDDADEKLASGESVPIDDVMAFNEGPYCSLDCSVNEDDP